MSTEFEVPLSAVKLVEILHGDTLQSIAAREMQDAERWVELASANGLLPPYITGDPALAGGRVKLYGQLLKVPAVASASAVSSSDMDEIYQRDIDLSTGFLEDDGAGELSVVSGMANLRQALSSRVRTEQGELMFHLDYGSRVRSILGAGNNPITMQLAAQYARAAIQSDPRVESIESASAAVSGDAVLVEVVANPITGRSIKVEARF